MKWTEKAWTHTEGIYHAIVEMPFIQELITGTLAPEKFKFYIAQDAIYLNHFGRALSLIAARIHDQDHVLQFIQFAQGAIVVEKALHTSYFKTLDIKAQPPISPTCHHYTNFVLSTAALAQVEVAVASVLPCFWIYKAVGDHILSQSKQPNNPYQQWIDTYAGEEFAILVEKALHIANALARKCTHTQQTQMLEAYEKGCYLEWKFWDSAWHLEEWT